MSIKTETTAAFVKPDHQWVQHRWPGGTGVGHTWRLECGEDCLPAEERTTTHHDTPPPLSWEE